jgi:hypothetical protein
VAATGCHDADDDTHGGRPPAAAVCRLRWHSRCWCCRSLRGAPQPCPASPHVCPAPHRRCACRWRPPTTAAHLWRDAQLVVEGVVPDLLHVVPVGHDAVLNRVPQRQNAALRLRLVAHVVVLQRGPARAAWGQCGGHEGSGKLRQAGRQMHAVTSCARSHRPGARGRTQGVCMPVRHTAAAKRELRRCPVRAARAQPGSCSCGVALGPPAGPASWQARTFCPMPTITPVWRGRPTMLGNTARGASSPAKPACSA